MARAISRKLIAGQIKFSSAVPVEAILPQLIDLKLKDREERYREQLVRACGDGGHALIFSYEYDGKPESCDELLQNLKDQMESRFGNNVTIDASGPCWLIK